MIPTGIDTTSSQYSKDTDNPLLATVELYNHKVSTPVESSDRNTVLETDVDGIYGISNVNEDVTIVDTVRKFFPWLGWFEGKVSLVEKNIWQSFYNQVRG